MATFARYEDIYVWQEGRELVKLVYAVSRMPEFARDYGLRDQIQRAAVSICSNIAEGFERRGNKDFIKFLWIAKGSAAEVSSQLYHLLDLGYIDQSRFADLYARAKKIGGGIFNLIKAMSTSEQSTDFVRL